MQHNSSGFVPLGLCEDIVSACKGAFGSHSRIRCQRIVHLSRVLVNQVGVLRAAPPPKILDLHDLQSSHY